MNISDEKKNKDIFQMILVQRFLCAQRVQEINGLSSSFLFTAVFQVFVGHSCKIGNMRPAGTLENQNP